MSEQTIELREIERKALKSIYLDCIIKQLEIWNNSCEYKWINKFNDETISQVGVV